MMSKGIVNFARQVRQEGQKITWPTRKETVTTTIVVLIMVFMVSMFLLFTDWIISTGIEFILNTGK